jgi:hypothetical protein
MLMFKWNIKVLGGGSVGGLSSCKLKVLVAMKGCQKVKKISLRDTLPSLLRCRLHILIRIEPFKQIV